MWLIVTTDGIMEVSLETITLYTKFLTWFDIQQDSHAIVIHISEVAGDLYSCTTGSKIALNPSPM